MCFFLEIYSSIYKTIHIGLFLHIFIVCDLFTIIFPSKKLNRRLTTNELYCINLYLIVHLKPDCLDHGQIF